MALAASWTYLGWQKVVSRLRLKKFIRTRTHQVAKYSCATSRAEAGIRVAD